jgi:hypothetical protein
MRKKWTANTEVTESLLEFREKRKWQIALRRYVLKGHKSSAYAPFFGIDIKAFRKWIELQFDDECSWENFSEKWQFDHIVPVAYFNFKDEQEMRLCWNFINIRVEACGLNKNRGNRVDVLAAKSFFVELYEKTGYHVCKRMIEKIESIEVSQLQSHELQHSFIREKKDYLELISNYTAYEYDRLNEGTPIEEIEREKLFLSKYK